MSQRVALHLDPWGLLTEDDESSYLTLDWQDDDAMSQLQGHSIIYRIALSPRQNQEPHRKLNYSFKKHRIVMNGAAQL